MKEILAEKEDICSCEQCRNDILALALNKKGSSS
ncbi:late competence development ComFB family protein [Acetohalobium arabaticum]